MLRMSTCRMEGPNPDTIRSPLGENDTQWARVSSLELSYSNSMPEQLPLPTFHVRSVPLTLPETTWLPSGDNTTDETRSLCPFSVWIGSPVEISHIRIVKSVELDAMRVLSGEPQPK